MYQYQRGFLMAVRRVLRIDNEEERKLLKAKSVKVKQFDKSLKALAQDMTETMRELNGVGLAAPQIGVLRRIVVVEEPAVERSGERRVGKEGRSRWAPDH